MISYNSLDERTLSPRFIGKRSGMILNLKTPEKPSRDYDLANNDLHSNTTSSNSSSKEEKEFFDLDPLVCMQIGEVLYISIIIMYYLFIYLLIIVFSYYL